MNGNPLLNMMPNNVVNNMISSLQGHPLFGLINVLRSGGDPTQLFSQITNSNPQMQQLMEAVNGKNQNEIVALAKNRARQQGIDVAQFAAQIGAPDNVVKMFSD